MPEKLTQGPRVGYDLSRTGAASSRGPNFQKKLAAAAWSGTWPAPGSTLDLDFANDRGWVRGVGQGSSMQAVTFTRASTGRYIDSTGTLVAATDNVPRFDWASTATVNRNLLYSTEVMEGLGPWPVVGTTNITQNAGIAPDGNTTAELFVVPNSGNAARGVYQSFSIKANETYTFSGYARPSGYNWLLIFLNGTGLGGLVWFNVSTGTVGTVSNGGTGGTVSASIEPAANGFYRCIVTQKAASTVGSVNFSLRVQSADNEGLFTGDSSSGLYIWGAQLETGSSATAYQSIAQLTTNTPLAAAPTCNGLLIEESRANRILWCRDATQANWTCTDVTAAKDQTGIDGVANAASSLTATADGGTCIQTITLASGSRTGSVYLKRLTGTGNVQVSLDGSTWSTVDLSSTEWRRIVLSGTVTNPVVGIKIATNGDAVAMDFAQVEDGAFATSPVLTTTASVTRSADLAEIAGGNFGFFRQQEETSVVEFVGQGATAGLLVNGSNIGNLQALNSLVARHANGSSNLDTTATYTLGSSAKAAVSGNRARRSISMNGSVAVINNQPVRTTAVTNIRIGANAISIKRASVFPFAASDSELQELTR